MDPEDPTAKPLKPLPTRDWFGHPRGLSVLFFSEMWERFSYYGMRALLILFMTAPTELGGFGFSAAKAGVIVGMYTAMVYLAGVAGGWLADKFIGLRNAVLWGGIGIMSGHICLALPWVNTFYLGLVLIVVGTGFLKPCISTLVGKLYAPDDIRRDSGFSIYYMGINLGAFIAPLVCGYLAQGESFKAFLTSVGLSTRSSWHFGFAAAAVGMGLGLVQYVIGWRHLPASAAKPNPPRDAAEAARNKKILVAVIGAVVGLPVLVGVLAGTGAIALSADRLSNWTGLLLLVLVIGVFGSLFTSKAFSGEERKRLLVVMLLFFGYAVFNSCFEQAASTMSLFADRNTRNELFGWAFPSSYWQSVNAIFVVLLAPLFAMLWLKLGRKGKDPSSPAKFGVAMVLIATSFLIMVPAGQVVAGDAGAKVSPMFLLSLYFIQTCAELCLSPVGLSSMTRLAPVSIGGMVMGIWFLGAAVGNYLAGKVSSFYDKIPLDSIFLYVAIVPLATAVLFFALVKPIRRMLGEARAPAH